ncbi:hypothetical protein FKW77_009908 [Venturia effusa]|uniref:non-specific serine/threonine protein kinase n=1 Tax=Venturia effusa TaxID=50376 RepID=A0A517L675_9PEZI|nr:hypothetical protein FKW77_009908 [Venturia effusa]
MAETRSIHDEARERFLKFLRQNAVADGTCGATAARSVPFDKLKGYLRIHIEELLVASSPAHGSRTFHAANILQSYCRVFAILLSINKGGYIFHFDQYDQLTDRRLPFQDNKDFPLQDDFYSPNFALLSSLASIDSSHPIVSFPTKELAPPSKEIAVPFAKLSFKMAMISSAPLELVRFKCCPHPYRIVKDFKDEREFEKEKNAFERLLKNGQTPDHIIDYLGSYEQGETRCIFLEHADIGTLDDYFQTVAHPTSGANITEFFSRIFDLLKGLWAVHQVEGSFVGLHGDIKPSNILALSLPDKPNHDCVLKLSDFGTSLFKDKTSGVTRIPSGSFARTYAPPEVWKNELPFLMKSDMLVTQAVDIWSLGCIFLEAMIFVLDGWNGLERFRNDRLAATKSLGTFKDGNCFHDGTRRLEVVDSRLDQIVKESRRSDEISLPLVWMVKEMLHEDPAKRPTCLNLIHRTDVLIKESFRVVQAPQNSAPTILPLHPAPLPSGPVPSSPNPEKVGIYGYQLPVSSSPLSPNLPIPTASLSPTLLAQRAELSTPPTEFVAAEMNPPRLVTKPPVTAESRHVPLVPASISQNSRIQSLPNGKYRKQEPPHWPVKESLEWKREHKRRTSQSYFSRITKSNKDKFRDVEGRTQLNQLTDRDHLIVADDSFSMRSHKLEVKAMVDLLAWTIKGFDPDGVELRLAVTNTTFNFKHSTELVESLNESDHNGPCDMSYCLSQIFDQYKDKVNRHRRGLGSSFRRMSIYVLTNGVWQTPSEVEEQITDFVKFLEQHEMDRRQVGIQSIRFGDDELGMSRLHNLDTLKKRNRVTRDIVDEEFWDGDFLKILLGSINPLFDDDGDDDNDLDVANANGFLPEAMLALAQNMFDAKGDQDLSDDISELTIKLKNTLDFLDHHAANTFVDSLKPVLEKMDSYSVISQGKSWATGEMIYFSLLFF